MLRTSVAIVALLATLGVDRAARPESNRVLITWTLAVTDSNTEKHEYAFLRDGGPVKVDVGDWKCTYGPVTPNEPSARMYLETAGLDCAAGKYRASTVVSCGPRSASGPRRASLSIGTGKKTDDVVIVCDPQQ
jgi:hypothetical protein